MYNTHWMAFLSSGYPINVFTERRSRQKKKKSHLSSRNLFGVRQLKHSRSCGRFSMHCLTWPKQFWNESHVSRVPLRTFRDWAQALPSASSPVHLDCTTSVPAFPSASKDLLRHVRRKSVKRGFLSLFAICRWESNRPPDVS